MQWEALTNLVQSINEREALNLAEDQPFNVYYRVSAGERVRSVQAVASGIEPREKTAQTVDALRSVIFRNPGHRVYLVAACLRGEKSPIDSVTMHGDPEDMPEVTTDQGAVPALAAALVASSRAADDRAMWIAGRNAELADRLLDSAQQLAETRAELRMVDALADMEQGSGYSKALELFAQSAGPVVAKLIADRMPAPQAPPRPVEGTPLATVEGLVDELCATLHEHPNVLGVAELTPEASGLLQRLQVATMQNLATPAQPTENAVP